MEKLNNHNNCFSPEVLRLRRYSIAAYRIAEEGFALLEIPDTRYVDRESLMMQLYLEYGERLMEAEVRYKRPPPTDCILEELESVVYYINDFIVWLKNTHFMSTNVILIFQTTNYANIVGNEE